MASLVSLVLLEKEVQPGSVDRKATLDLLGYKVHRVLLVSHSVFFHFTSTMCIIHVLPDLNGLQAELICDIIMSQCLFYSP